MQHPSTFDWNRHLTGDVPKLGFGMHARALRRAEGV